ncbi:MAG: transglycosylase domain-containing protein [Candidatus Latescibacterota bacterium]|nr:MAG: transglycosylase domain-containing protein [Candidatus Latescibacterota bacterium]
MRWEKRKLRRALRLSTLTLALLVVGLSVLYLIHLGALRSRVLSEFEALAQNHYYRIVSQPASIRVGTDARATGIAARLDRAGYRRVSTRPRPGEFHVGAGAILFQQHAGPGDDAGPLVSLRLDGPVVDHIEVDGRERHRALLPEEHLTSFRRSLWERRAPRRYAEIPPGLVLAVLAAEDRRFFGHAGLDGRGIARALLRNLRERRIAEGGSTITQQVVKQILERRGRSLHAKIDEAVVALELERRFPKKKILQVYLNEVYLGQEGPFAIHGVAEGARHFFGKPLRELERREQIELAAAIRAPNAASPLRNPDRLQPYADAVAAAIDDVEPPAQEPDAAARGDDAASLLLASGERFDFASSQMAYYFDLLEKEWASAHTKHRIRAPATLVIGVDPLLQLRASRALEAGLKDAATRTAKRHDDAKLQGAVVVLDSHSGALRAVVGGTDFARAPFNRAIDIARPVGSTFKPIVFLAALGGRTRNPSITQSSWLPDEQREYRVGRQRWRPANFDDQYRGWVTARQALAQSINAATVALGMDVGVDKVAQLAEHLGIRERVPQNPSILLGAVDTSPVRLSRAYASLSNGGFAVTPRALVEVRHRDAAPLSLQGERTRILDAQVAYVVTDMLVGAMRTGTGRSAERYGFRHLATGKTGTSDGTRDSWFVGYTPEVVTTVWVGYDDYAETGLTGAHAALPVWALLMRGWLGQGWDEDFEPPPGIAFRRIDPNTGEVATRRCPSVEIAAYMEGTAPRKACREHGGWWDRDAKRGPNDDARRDRWLGMRKKRGFWARLKDAFGV